MPGPPSTPKGPIKVTDVDRTSVSLQWEPPTDDGGSPITGYILERREAKRTMWTKVDKTTSTSYKVDSLIEDTEYYFRVSAENKIGTSEPLEMEKGVTPESPFGVYLTFWFCYFIYLSLWS